MLFAGMLFWTKLRLVSDIPRTAYAIPSEKNEDNAENQDNAGPATDQEDADASQDADDDQHDDLLDGSGDHGPTERHD